MEGAVAFVSLGLLTGAGGAGNAVAALRGRTALRVPAALDLLRALAAFPMAFVGAARPLPRHPRLCQLMAFTQALALAGHGLAACALVAKRATAPLAVALAAAVAALATAWPPEPWPPPLGLRCTLPRVLAPSPLPLAASLAAFTATNFLYFRLFLQLRARRRMQPVQHPPPALSGDWNFVASPPIATMLPHNNRHQAAAWRRHQDTNRLTAVCFALHLIVSVTWLPYVVVLFLLVCGQEGVPEWVEVAVTWLTYIQTTVTPVAFSTLPAKRRRANSPTFSSLST